MSANPGSSGKQTKKSNTPSDIYISKYMYNEIRSLYPQHIPIFTDGSKQSNHTATAVVLKSHIITKRLPNSVSIYTAELYAILLALNELSKQQHKHYLLFSDSWRIATTHNTWFLVSPKRHLDQFSRVCIVHQCDQDRQTDRPRYL